MEYKTSNKLTTLSTFFMPNPYRKYLVHISKDTRGTTTNDKMSSGAACQILRPSATSTSEKKNITAANSVA